MTGTDSIPMVERTDADLVTESRAGSRGAFRQIVERYQTLVCSVAYSATGNVSRSEDLAQETFIAAWAQLRSLREPEKLRGWLCGIVRHRIHRSRREDVHEPVQNAAPLEHAHDSPAPDALPSEHAISREEAAILWRSLEKIPELYREPLVLFYREHQSIERVAEELDLSVDAVKQRLSRGRRLLHREVLSFVENTLRRSTPNQAFSGVVLASLPFAVAPVATAGAGVAAKSTAAAKAGFLALVLAPLAPFLGIAAGVVAQSLIIRSVTTDPRKRIKGIAAVIAGWTIYVGLAAAGEAAVHWVGREGYWTDRIRFAAGVTYWWLFIIATITFQLVVIGRVLRARRQREQAGETPELAPAVMKRSTLGAVVAGSYLAMFSWFIVLVWRCHDSMGVAIATVAMLVLGGWTFSQLCDASGTAVARRLGAHLALAGGIILLILNLRADVWIAARYGVSVGEANRVLPVWMIPLLSLVLVVWTAAGIAVAGRSQRGS